MLGAGEEYPSFIWNLVALYTAMICACVPALNIFFAHWLAPKGILARFHTSRGRSEGVPEAVSSSEQGKSEGARTAITITTTTTMTKSDMLTRDGTSVWTDESTDLESQLQMPNYAATMKETHAV